MSFNLVTVNITVDGSPADATGPEGNYVMTPAGVMWPDTASFPVVPMVVHGALVPNAITRQSTAAVQLVASDNFGAGVLAWDVILNVRGLPSIVVPGVVVNFAAGATQSIWTILQAAGWAPVVVP